MMASAAITGTVIEATTKTPMPRVRVSLNHQQRVTYTDANGRFSFPKLSAGPYEISAQLAGYLDATYGARKPGGRGVDAALRDAEDLRGITLVMHKGGALGGRVLDQDGRPMTSASVTALVMRWRSDGTREFVPSKTALTDDRGEYRLFGLFPGTYLLQMNPTRVTGVPALERAVELDGVQPLASSGYVTTFFPGVTTARDAGFFVVEADSERSGMDMQLRAVPLARIRGRVDSATVAAAAGESAPAGGPRDPGFVQLREAESAAGPVVNASAEGRHNAVVMPDGSFAFSAVPPGQYELHYGRVQTGRTVGVPMPVTISGRDVLDILLVAAPGVTVAGEQVLEGGAGGLPMSVSLSPLLGSGAGYIVSADERGRFVFSDVLPGRYLISPLTMPPGWYLARVETGAAQVAARVIEVGAANITGVRVTYRTPVPTLSGVIRRENLTPVSDYTLVIFPADRKDRPISAVGSVGIRPDSNGFYSTTLRPGNYLLAAVDDVEAYQWMDPAFLESLIPSAMKITIAEGQRLTQDLLVK